MTNQIPSLPSFEKAVRAGDHDQAMHGALAILQAIDANYGRLNRIELGENTANRSDDEIALTFCTRFGSAFGQMLVDPKFTFTALGFEQLVREHRWLDLIYALSGFRSPDYLLPLLAHQAEANSWRFEGNGFLSVLATRSLGSILDIDLNQWWQSNKPATAVSLLNAIGTRYIFTPRAFDFREKVLAWLPDHLDEVKLGNLTLAKVAEYYMHCSYATGAKKHAIKAPIMRQLNRVCRDAGCVELPADAAKTARLREPSQRPKIVVVFEPFFKGHSVYRTHSASVRALRKDFHVIGVGHPGQFDWPSEELFDEFLPIRDTEMFAGIKDLSDDITRCAPDIVYFLGVGMISQVIALASLRLAPVQCVSFGHTATTRSPAIDYFIVPEDFVGSTDCFSEQVLPLPKEAMPFVERPLPDAARARAPESEKDGIVRIAIPAATMKLNPRFFEALRQIAARVRTPVQFIFMPLTAVGLSHLELGRQLRAQVPHSIAFSEAPFDVYAERLAACDLFLCPFPYGNMNSIVDAAGLGLTGVCLDGAEAHAHADVAIFARLGFPAELAARNVDEYVAATARLIDDAEWRAQCRQTARNSDFNRGFYQGDASLFSQAMLALMDPAAGTPAAADPQASGTPIRSEGGTEH
jgi:HMW1C N-terminal/HMW1 domain 2